MYDPSEDRLRPTAAGVLGESRPDPGHAAVQRCGQPVPIGDLPDHRGQQERRPRPAGIPTPQSLTAAGHGDTTTEIEPLDTFYYAEDYHQQYLDKNPGGYCNMHGTGISCSITGTSGLDISAH